MYKIMFHRSAAKQLHKVPVKDRERITDRLYVLAQNPDTTKLDVKKMSGEPGYRLRVGDWRIIFAKDDCLRVLYIQKIGARGGVYQ
jgi:mRNA interferase RelE/StbE